MVALKAPNGVVVHAADAAVEGLTASGFKKIATKKPAAKPAAKKTTKKTTKKTAEKTGE